MHPINGEHSWQISVIEYKKGKHNLFIKNLDLQGKKAIVPFRFFCLSHFVCGSSCVNCSGEHPANSKQCPAWEKEKKILKIKCEQNISFPEARKQYEQFYDTRSYASAVKPSTCNKSTQTENKTTQTDDSFDEYLKKQEKSPSEKTP